MNLYASQNTGPAFRPPKKREISALEWYQMQNQMLQLEGEVAAAKMESEQLRRSLLEEKAAHVASVAGRDVIIRSLSKFIDQLDAKIRECKNEAA